MEPSPDQLFGLFLLVCCCIAFTVTMTVILYHMIISERRCTRLVDTIRAMGLAASNPLAAARLQQQKDRQDTTKKGILTKIAQLQGAKAQERHAQNRAALTSKPPGVPTMRYIAPDEDLCPPDPGDNPSPSKEKTP